MKERPILFSAPMIRALLAGTKTVTRRIVKMPDDAGKVTIDRGGSIFGPGPYLKVENTSGDPAPMHPRIHCPYGYPGDQLWVRETHCRFSVGEGMDRPVPECVSYRATNERGLIEYTNTRGEVLNLKVTKWTPSIFMPRWASRITLEITGVRCERLHDITEAEAMAEGVEPLPFERKLYPSKLAASVTEWNHRAAYQLLWEQINGAESWRSNPWVWCVTFKRIAQPITAGEVKAALAIGAKERKAAEKTLKRSPRR